MNRREEIAAGLSSVRSSVKDAAVRCGRDPASVTLVAVSKTMPLSDLQLGGDLGQLDFGENYGQEFRDKRIGLADEPQIRLHFIGPLQRNKVKYIAGFAALIHSVDSIEDPGRAVAANSEQCRPHIRAIVFGSSERRRRGAKTRRFPC